MRLELLILCLSLSDRTNITTEGLKGMQGTVREPRSTLGKRSRFSLSCGSYTRKGCRLIRRVSNFTCHVLF